MAERLNFLRFISHFRSIHRGQVGMLCSREYASDAAAAAAISRSTLWQYSSAVGWATVGLVCVCAFSVFRRDEDDRVPPADGRRVGLPVPRAHARWLALRSAPVPSRVHACTRAPCLTHTHVVPHASLCAQRQKCPTRATVTFGRAPQPPRVAVPCSDAHAQTVGASGGRRMLGAGDGADVPARDLEGRVPPGAA